MKDMKQPSPLDLPAKKFESDNPIFLRNQIEQLIHENLALQVSNNNLTLALESADLATFEWDLTSNKLIANRLSNRLLYGQDAPLITTGTRFFETLDPDAGASLRLKRSLEQLPFSEGNLCIFMPFALPCGSNATLDLRACAQIVSPDCYTIIGTIKDITHITTLANKVAQQEGDIDHLAKYDGLTGLPNRLFFAERLEQTTVEAARLSKRFAVLLLDVDGFKLINDSLGHALGDQILLGFGGRLLTCIRPEDTLARLGGDEFAIILNDIDNSESAFQIATDILETLAIPVSLADETLTLTASIGISLYPYDGVDRHTLLKAADSAMYSAKAQGRNRALFHTADMSSRNIELMMMEQGLKRALSEQQFQLYYQPQICLKSGRVIGVEALLRWKHPEQGMIPPDRFIPVAESNGLIIPIGLWVMNTAYAEPELRKNMGGKPLRIAINVSAQQLVSPHFVQQLEKTLDQLQIPRHQVEIEITESTLQIMEDSVRLLHEIKSLGVSIAIDDFGTGYSSLNVLKHLPIDLLKIDRTFIKDIPERDSDIAIVKAIIGLAHTLNMRVIAEGVETSAQLEILRDIGCDEIQGFLFSRPLPVGELVAWLKSNKRQPAVP